MKRDPASGEFYLIEPNLGRPTGRSAIAEAGGVELLYTMYCDLAGLPLPEARVQRYGEAKWIYLRHDLQAAFYRWRRGELSLGEWRRSVAGPKAWAVFSARDPLPFLLDLVKPFRELLRRRRPAP
jgi:predicted ATP-grasp superfamily ATP-dependent carboligase